MKSGVMLMAGNRELGFPKPEACNLRELGAKITLQNVRKQGHTYVDLREDGKRIIFFCTLCLAPCYSDKVLFDHLEGNAHAQRYAAAKVTLLQSNPWPFSDGIHFFNTSNVNDKQLLTSNADSTRLLESSVNGNECLDLVCHHGNGKSSNGNADCVYDVSGNDDGGECDMLIPGVLVNDEISNLEVRFLGVGKIGARFFEKDGVPKGMSRIWCEWLGNVDLADDELIEIPEHDYAVVVFSYNYDLGRKSLFDDVKYLLPSSTSYLKNSKRKRQSFSDPEDESESLSNQSDSSGEKSLSGHSSPSSLLLDRSDNSSLHQSFISSKSFRRELRRQQRIAAERMCDICQHKMLPGKDVAALLNMKTGKLACSSRNVNGAYHLYHISCLIHWILFCDSEIFRNQLNTNESVKPKTRRRTRRKLGNGTKFKDMSNDGGAKLKGNQINSVFCPDCQGTGIIVTGDDEKDMEKPRYPLAEMFKFKIRASDAHRAWMKNPEVLQNCSTGFRFPSETGETCEEMVSQLKLLHFYRADI